MIYRSFQNMSLSALGFGAMRLPLLADGTVDQSTVEAMTDYALEHGVNYFDTAWPYHNGQSELAMGKALNRHPRTSWYLASKYPGHQISASYDPADIFEKQLKKCGVDYFDFYLLHNVYEHSIDTYLDPRWGILDYFREQRDRGRIRHLGFSSHGNVDLLARFLDVAGDDMEFCQIQLNYLDWTLQDAKGKVKLLNERQIPIWVMEPVRGGRLAHLDEAQEASLKARRPNESVPAWGLRFLQDMPGVAMILSGMSDLDQMKDNVKTFETEDPLSVEEKDLLFQIAEGLKDSVPCTACRYCVNECPQGLDIPTLIRSYNDLKVLPTMTLSMFLEGLPEDKKPSACLGCGRCAAMCPQKIQIPQVMRDMAEKMQTLPSWAAQCRERERLQVTVE